MKFYKRFPGDINIKTGHLTPSQFGCYDRLLDHYYATERPIPAAGAHSICRAVTAADRQACDVVLAEFFVLTAAGWEQQRAEEMIAEAQPKIEAARTNGLKGGRPVGSGKKPSGLFAQTQSGTETGDFEKASQSQSTSSPTSKKKATAAPSLPAPDGVDPQVWVDWLKLRKAKKAPVTETVLRGAESEAAKAGMTMDAFLRVWCRRGSQGLEADWLKSHERPSAASSEPAWRTEQRDRVAEFAGPAAAKRPQLLTATQESFDVDARFVG
jgi:uncharacterized protein YdaU (DUF1376 family)